MSLEEKRHQRLNIKNMQNTNNFLNNAEKQANAQKDSSKLSIEEKRQQRMNFRNSSNKNSQRGRSDVSEATITY